MNLHTVSRIDELLIVSCATAHSIAANPEFQESYYRDLSKLTTLRLNGNKLVGELPSYDGAFYPRLQTLDVVSSRILSSNEWHYLISCRNVCFIHLVLQRNDWRDSQLSEYGPAAFPKRLQEQICRTNP